MKLFKVKNLKFKDDTTQTIPVYISSNIPQSFGRYRIGVGRKSTRVSYSNASGETWEDVAVDFKDGKRLCQRHYEKKIIQDHLITAVSINARLL